MGMLLLSDKLNRLTRMRRMIVDRPSFAFFMQSASHSSNKEGGVGEFRDVGGYRSSKVAFSLQAAFEHDPHRFQSIGALSLARASSSIKAIHNPHFLSQFHSIHRTYACLKFLMLSSRVL